jgi:hypothetical protein
MTYGTIVPIPVQVVVPLPVHISELPAEEQNLSGNKRKIDLDSTGVSSSEELSPKSDGLTSSSDDQERDYKKAFYEIDEENKRLKEENQRLKEEIKRLREIR